MPRFSLKVFLVLEKCFTILFNGAEPFDQIANILLTEGPVGNLVKIVQEVLEKMLKRSQDFIHVYSAGLGGSV